MAPFIQGGERLRNVCWIVLGWILARGCWTLAVAVGKHSVLQGNEGHTLLVSIENLLPMVPSAVI